MSAAQEPAAGAIRVLHVVQRFSPELGGLETHVAEVTKRLAATSDIIPTVLTTDRTGELPREELINGVRVIRRRSWRRRGEEYFAPGIPRVIREGGWDLIHVQGSQTTVPTLAMLAAARARIPFVVTFHSGGHSSRAHGPITWLQNRINRPLFARAAALIAVSRFERTRFQAITGLPLTRFTIVGNGGALPPVASDALPVPGSIVTSGRLEKYKGHHRVIRALPLVRESIPHATVTVLGSGPFEPELRRIAVEAGVADAVTFRHLLPAQRAEMSDVLARSTVMAALSDYEAHPVAIMEAVALGLPVVGSDIAGIGDLVEDGLVIGVDPRADDAEVARLLTRELRAGTGESHRAPDVELPTWESATERLAAVYRRVASAAPIKVVHIVTTLSAGGAERQVESIVSHSRNRQYVLALYAGGPVEDSLRAAGRAVGVLDLVGIRRLLALPILVARLRRLRPDVVQVHLLSGQLWGLPAARLAGVPVILSTEHSLMDASIENRPLTPGLRALYLGLSRLATRTVAVSDATAIRLMRWGVPARRIDVVEDGIDVAGLAFSAAARSAVRAELGIPQSVTLVGAVGRLEPVKRFPQLLVALAPTLRSGERELVIAGSGPLEHELASMARSLGVADCVHLLGARRDIPAVLSAVDVLVSPSRDETFGMAVVEAVAAGLPVVFAQCPALDELVEALPAFARIAGGGDLEEESIRRGIDGVLATAAGRRIPVPAELRDAYDIRSTVARLDELTAAALRSRRTPRGRPGPSTRTETSR